MKGGTHIMDNSYEEKAIDYIKKSLDIDMPLNQKSQSMYGQERAKYLREAVSELNKKIDILYDYSKNWSEDMFGTSLLPNNFYNKNNNMNNNNNTHNNYNANNENMEGGKRKHKKHRKHTRKIRKYRK